MLYEVITGTKHIAENPELAKKYAAAVPLGRIGMPEDMVGAVNFLVITSYSIHYTKLYECAQS